MSLLDFNDADAQRETGGLIPNNTVALAVLTIRPGGKGEGGWEGSNKAGDKLQLDVEFTVSAGKYERRKFWKHMVTAPADSEAGRITRSQLRAALESAHNIAPSDGSDAALLKRRANSYGDFDGLTVCVRIGVEKKEGYSDKNTLRGFVTPDDNEYIAPGPQQGSFTTAGAAVKQAALTAGAATNQAVNGGKKPAWAS